MSKTRVGEWVKWAGIHEVDSSCPVDKDALIDIPWAPVSLKDMSYGPPAGMWCWNTDPENYGHIAEYRLCEVGEMASEREETFLCVTQHVTDRSAGVVDHIRKELREIEAAPGDLEEWIDVVILALDGARRAGYSPEQIIEQLVAKQTKNENRKWPDWRTQPADKAIEHERGG